MVKSKTKSDSNESETGIKKQVVRMKLYNKEEIQQLADARQNSNAPTLALIKHDGISKIKTDGDKKPQKQTKKTVEKKKSSPKEAFSNPLKHAFFDIVAILAILGLIGMILFWRYNMLEWLIVSIVVLIWGTILTLWSGITISKGKELWTGLGDLTKRQKQSIGLWLFAIVFVVILFIIGFGQQPLDPAIPWFITLIMDVRIIIYMIEVLTEQKAAAKEMGPTLYEKRRREVGDVFNPRNFIAQSIIVIILFTIVLHLLMGNDMYGQIVAIGGTKLDPMKTWTAMFNTCMILVAISGVIAMTQLQRAPYFSTDYDKTGIIGYLVMIVVPILILIILPMKAESAMVGASMISGVVGRGGTDYFGTVYVAILDNGATQFSLVIILISSLSILIGKARGQAGTGNMVIGALGVAGVPMIVALMAFIGKVPPPPVFLELFDEGFAQLIFAISYTSVISLALALVGVFYEFVPSAASGNLDDD
jgi:hypothetical protein